VELYIHSPSTPSWRRAQLKHKDNFTFLPSLRELVRLFKWEVSNVNITEGED
jgi:hypothetical protein